MSACVHMYTCRLASKEAELQNVEKLLLGIFGVPLQEQKQLMRDMLKTMTMLQSKIVITYVFLVPVYWGSKNYNRCLEVTIPSQEPSRLLPLKIQNKQMKIPHPGSQEKIQQYGDMYVYSCECLRFSACTNWTFGFLSRYVRMPRKKCDRSELDNAAERMLGILSILAYWSICHP